MTLCLLVIIYPRFEARFVVSEDRAAHIFMVVFYDHPVFQERKLLKKVGYKLQIEPLSCVSEDLNFLNVSTSGMVKFFTGR
jgi:hypothetical protein